MPELYHNMHKQHKAVLKMQEYIGAFARSTTAPSKPQVTMSEDPEQKKLLDHVHVISTCSPDYDDHEGVKICVMRPSMVMLMDSTPKDRPVQSISISAHAFEELCRLFMTCVNNKKL